MNREIVEATSGNLPAHVDENPDTCGCPVLITSPDGETETCDTGVGWVLREIQDTYDSGYERMVLADCWVVDGFWVICDGCAYALDEDSDDGWGYEIPPIPEGAGR